MSYKVFSLVGALLCATACDATTLQSKIAHCEGSECSFCSAGTWNGMVPTASDDLVIPNGTSVVMDCEADVHTLTVEEGGTLRASRAARSRLTLHGNLIVRGTIDYGVPVDRIPASIHAEIVFAGMHDDDYVGTTTPFIAEMGATEYVPTPMRVIDSDVGLWVMGSGRLLAAGAEKRAWGTLHEGAGPGDVSFTVDDASGWQVGDRIVLTPTASLASGTDFAREFDESIIAAIDGSVITLDAVPSFAHEGCEACMRRGEAGNLTRNVVIRSADDTAHAHVMVSESAIAQLDSVELRWLGPEKCGGPDRRAPLWFHEQGDASEESFVRHVSIWGGQHHFMVVQQSNGIEVDDVIGYDGASDGFLLEFESNACATRCLDRETPAPKRIVLNHVLAAKVQVGLREEGCVRIAHRMTGIDASGGEQTGVQNSVATGIGYEGIGEDISGFRWGEGGTGRPMNFVFNHNVAHNIDGNGALIWHNGQALQDAYVDNAFWTVSARGIHWGAYDNGFLFEDLLIADTGGVSVGVKAIPTADRERIDGAVVDDMQVLAYVFVQTHVATFRNITFTGAKPVGVSQIHEGCVGGDENDPMDSDCIRVWLRFENPIFPAGVVPFDFGMTFNKHSLWEVRGFASPDYPELPRDFDLYRADNEVAGGSYFAAFDAWLVPR